jgi:hypothetical protein
MSIRVPRQPVAPAAAPTMAARTRWQDPEENGWVDVKDAARRAQVSERTLFRWCATRAIVARRLAGGRGPWRVRLDTDGFPMDRDAAEGAP